MALNPQRRGWVGQLTAYARSLGVEPITGKPYHPQTQGKNERFHQTLFRWLDKQPLAATIPVLQAQVDAFDVVYNTQRPHQGLPGRITPQAAWEATPVAQAPRPAPAPVIPVLPTPASQAPTPLPPSPRTPLPVAGQRQARVLANGTVSLKNISFLVSHAHAGQTINIAWDADTVTFADSDAEILTEYAWPAAGTRYVSHHEHTDPTRKRPGRPRKTPPPNPEVSPKSSDTNRHRSPDTEPSPMSGLSEERWVCLRNGVWVRSDLRGDGRV